MPNKESQNTRTKKRIYGNEQRCDIEKLTQPTQGPTLVRGQSLYKTYYICLMPRGSAATGPETSGPGWTPCFRDLKCKRPFLKVRVPSEYGNRGNNGEGIIRIGRGGISLSVQHPRSRNNQEPGGMQRLPYPPLNAAVGVKSHAFQNGIECAHPWTKCSFRLTTTLQSSLSPPLL